MAKKKKKSFKKSFFLMARPSPPPPLNGLAISGGIFCAASLIKSLIFEKKTFKTIFSLGDRPFTLFEGKL